VKALSQIYIPRRCTLQSHIYIYIHTPLFSLWDVFFPVQEIKYIIALFLDIVHHHTQPQPQMNIYIYKSVYIDIYTYSSHMKSLGPIVIIMFALGQSMMTMMRIVVLMFVRGQLRHMAMPQHQILIPPIAIVRG